jgi:hypothetical protein
VRGTGLFYAACAAGLVTSLSLAVAEATSRPQVKVGTVHHVTTGLVTVVSASLTNRVSTPRCPDVRVAALDSQSRTLAQAHASGGVLRPRVATDYTGTLTMTAKQYREDVSKYVVYVYAEKHC